MAKYFFIFWSLISVLFSGAQNTFEGTLTITYQSGNGKPVVAEVKMKGDKVYIKQTENGNPKYDFYTVNLANHDFYTVSTPDKKVIIKYNYEQLIDFYVTNKLKEGYQKNYNFNYKSTDKVREENGIKLTKATGEDGLLKSTVWLSDQNIPINKLIPLLRLMGNWNEAQGAEKPILESEVISKDPKNKSTVQIEVKKEKIPAAAFDLPKGYLTKDFAKLMTEDKGNGKLSVLIQTFAGF